MSTQALPKRSKIRKSEELKAPVADSKQVLEAVPTIEEFLRLPPIICTTTKDFEKVSKEIQKIEGIYG